MRRSAPSPSTAGWSPDSNTGQDVLFKVRRRTGNDQFDTVYLAGVVLRPEQ